MNDFYNLKDYLQKNLPQEWLVSESIQTTCRGSVNFLRVDEPVTTLGKRRRLVCLIEMNDHKIEVTSPDILSWQAHHVIIQIKHAFAEVVIADRCLNLTECDLKCTACHKVWELFH